MFKRYLTGFFLFFILLVSESMAADVNVAPLGTASQSSTRPGGDASKAIDRDTNGAWNHGSIAHTKKDTKYEWWLLDLGSVQTINTIKIFPRTDGDLEKRIANVYIMVSDTPFSPDTNPTAFNTVKSLADWKMQVTANPSDNPISFNVGGVQGRYILVQKDGHPPAGTRRKPWLYYPLNIAELEVYVPSNQPPTNIILSNKNICIFK